MLDLSRCHCLRAGIKSSVLHGNQGRHDGLGHDGALQAAVRDDSLLQHHAGITMLGYPPPRRLDHLRERLGVVAGSCFLEMTSSVPGRRARKTFPLRHCVYCRGVGTLWGYVGACGLVVANISVIMGALLP